MLNYSSDTIISLGFVLIISFTVHEFAHAWMADSLGDGTPRSQGRLTLNPVAHIDLFGALMLFFAGFGWAKPVQVDMYMLRRNAKNGPLYVSLAGPVSNLIMAVVAAIPFKLGIFYPSLSSDASLPSLDQVFTFLVLYNLILFFFNLIPVFPLDGEKILSELLPHGAQEVFLSLRRFTYGPLLILIVILPRLNVPILQWLVFSPAYWLTGILL
jgi:Zn-dependent protease